MAVTSIPREPVALLAATALALAWSGVEPTDRITWWLEVSPVLIGAPLLVASYSSFRLSPLLYRLLFVHALILIVGGHYTYSKVPLGIWLQDVLDLSRNPYDRVGHFAQGFVPAILAREILLRLSPLQRGRWLIFLVCCVGLAFSAFYELIEWWAAILGGVAAESFLGTQGDVWDTQWDMFTALAGSIGALLLLSRWHDRSMQMAAALSGTVASLCLIAACAGAPPSAALGFAFDGAGNTLVGELRLPGGRAPHPAVVFVHGSGAASRHLPYLEPIRDEFLRRGFATLIWSKPGVDESTGDFLAQAMADRAAETAAAVARLAEREDIDRDRIGLWGISEAGWVMPLVPALAKIAFVISVGGPAQSGEEQDLYGADRELARLGISESERAAAREQRRELYALFRECADYEAFAPRYQSWLAVAKQRSWYPQVERELAELPFHTSAFSVDRRMFEFAKRNLSAAPDRTLIAPPRLESLRMPVLAIYGADDAFVDPRLGADAYLALASRAGNPDVRVLLIEGADHLIRKPDREGRVLLAPGYLEAMGNWLSDRRRARAALDSRAQSRRPAIRVASARLA